jgi:hypothetical protein
MSPLFEGIELLLRWQSPGVNASFPTLVHAFTAHGQPFLSFVSRQKYMSPGLILIYLLGFGLRFDHKETT